VDFAVVGVLDLVRDGDFGVADPAGFWGYSVSYGAGCLKGFGGCCKVLILFMSHFGPLVVTIWTTFERLCAHAARLFRRVTSQTSMSDGRRLCRRV
jgi:hypothetical protein